MLSLQDKIDLFKLNDDKKFRAIFKTPKFDWCLATSQKGNGNHLIRMFISVFKLAAPQYFHECPYLGRYEGRNISFFKELSKIFPAGTYKLIITLSTRTGKEFLVFTADFITF